MEPPNSNFALNPIVSLRTFELSVFLLSDFGEKWKMRLAETYFLRSGEGK